METGDLELVLERGRPPPRPANGTTTHALDAGSSGCGARRAEERRRLAEAGARGHDEPPYALARDAFGAPRYRVLYRAWLRQGAAALGEVVSPVLADALARGTGQLERHLLSHAYLHLAPLVSTA
jgi:hypothetical protein